MVVATSVTSIKQLTLVQKQQVRYEDIYRAVINIKDYIDADICQKKRSMSGTLNDFEYKAECHQELEKRKYVKAFEQGEPEGNIGNIAAILSTVVLHLKKNSFEKEYSYQKLTTKKVF
jgi:hypothetical protein